MGHSTNPKYSPGNLNESESSKYIKTYISIKTYDVEDPHNLPTWADLSC